MNSNAIAVTHEELLAVYHQHEHLRAELAEKDHCIAEKDHCIAEKDHCIAEKDHCIAEKDHCIAEKDHCIATHQQQIAAQQHEMAERQQQILQLQQQVEKLQRMLFGSRRERFEKRERQLPLEFVDGQMLLPFLTDPSHVTAAVEAEIQTITYTRKRAEKKHPGRMPLPEHLPVVEIIHEPEEDVSQMRRIGQEITDELGYTPAKLFIRRHIRPKYVAAEDAEGHQHVAIARLPERPIDKCEAGVEVLTQLAIDKHIYHLPIYRQLQRFEALGVVIPPSTADNWQRLTGLALRPLYAAHVAALEMASYLQADETTIKVQDRTKKGTTHTGVMWVYHAPLQRMVVFDYQRGHGRANCHEILSTARGYLQTDGTTVYDHHKARADIIPLACWAHVRRKFFDAASSDAERSRIALALIGKLYAVEDDARQRSLAPLERKELRLERSLPLLNLIGRWLATEVEQTLPRSPIGKAIRYAITLWDELENYLLDGHLEIDNNLIENQIRPLAIGRKNYLFAGSHSAAVTIAMYRSFFGTCRLNGIDPQAWLLYVLKNISSTPTNQYLSLLPQNIDAALLG